MSRHAPSFSLPRRSACLGAVLLALAPWAAQAQAVRSTLAVGEVLEISSFDLRSPNGRYRFLATSRSVLLDDRRGGNLLWQFDFYNPLPQPAGVVYQQAHKIMLDRKGSLVLLASDGKVVWSTQSDFPGVQKLVLDDNGDLSIQDAAGQAIWGLRDPATKAYTREGNGLFLKYAGPRPDPSRYSSKQVDLDDLDKLK